MVKDAQMPDKQILLVAAPGRLQEGLQVLLATLPGAAVTVAAYRSAAAAQVAIRRPQLVIVAGGDVAGEIGAFRDKYPSPRLLALVEQARQIAPAQAAGADAVLVQGAPPDRLLRRVRELLGDASQHLKEVQS